MKKQLISLFLILYLAAPALAVNKIYVESETAVTFADGAQTPTVTITFSALATLTGRVSAQYDRGAGSLAPCFRWRATAQLTGTNVVGQTIEYYLATSNGTNIDGEVGTADAALASVNVLPALKYLGSVPVVQTTTNTNTTGSGVYCTSARYVSVVVWNASSLPFKTDTAVHKFSLIPFAPEVQ